MAPVRRSRSMSQRPPQRCPPITQGLVLDADVFQDQLARLVSGSTAWVGSFPVSSSSRTASATVQTTPNRARSPCGLCVGARDDLLLQVEHEARQRPARTLQVCPRDELTVSHAHKRKKGAATWARYPQVPRSRTDPNCCATTRLARVVHGCPGNASQGSILIISSLRDRPPPSYPVACRASGGQ